MIIDMKSKTSKAFVPSVVALLIGGLMFPYPAYAVGRDVGNLIVDCTTGRLEGQTIVYLEVGDTFTIENDGAENCMIDDPNGILTGEVADLGASTVSSPITIDRAGTFTISENAGSAGGATADFLLTPGILFAGDERGESAQLGETFLYEEVFLLDGTTVVDATVTVTEVLNQNYDEFELDVEWRNASGGIGTSLGSDADAEDGFVEYSVSFHEPGNPGAPISLSNISVTIKDIESLEYITSENVDSYTLSSTPPTNLDARTEGTTLFIEELNNIESSDENQDERHWAVLNFDSTSTITIGLGFDADSESDGDRFDAMFTVSEPDPSGLAATGANVGWYLSAGLIAVIAGSSFLVVSRRRRI
jgi:LPXTG-motif cell wall-anchored protein